MAQEYDPYGYNRLSLGDLLVVHKENWLKDKESPKYLASARAIRAWPGQSPTYYERNWARKTEGLPWEEPEGDDLGVIKSPKRFSQDLDGSGSVSMGMH